MEATDNYRVEVSGWDLADNFFVEKTTLRWGANAHKEIVMRSEMREGSVVFVRLMQPTTARNGSIPYQVVGVDEKNASGRATVFLSQMKAIPQKQSADAASPKEERVA